MGEIAAELSAPAARIGAAAWPGPPRIDAGIELALQRRTRRRAGGASPAGHRNQRDAAATSRADRFRL